MSLSRDLRCICDWKFALGASLSANRLEGFTISRIPLALSKIDPLRSTHAGDTTTSASTGTSIFVNS